MDCPSPAKDRHRWQHCFELMWAHGMRWVGTLWAGHVTAIDQAYIRGRVNSGGRVCVDQSSPVEA